MARVCRAVYLLALGVYLGIGVAVVIAGPTVFRTFESRTIAGNAIAAILRGTTTADLLLAIALAVTGVVWLPRASPGLQRTLAAAALALMLALIGVYRFGLMPAMYQLRGEIGTFDAPEVTPARARFDSLHHTYERLYGANLIVSLAAFALAAGLEPRARSAAPSA